MTDKPRKSGLLGSIEEARGDPLSLDSLQRLWQIDFVGETTDELKSHMGVEDSFGALANEQADGAMHAELGRMLERFRHPTLIVRSDGRIEAMNLSARRTIDVDPDDSIDDIGYDLIPAEALSRKVARFLNTARNAPSRVDLWQTIATTTERPATLAVFRQERANPTALLFVIDPVWKGEAEAMARQSFELTTAESEILSAFLNGCSLREIGVERGRSHATVRTQFHTIMTKFGVRTQAGLVRAALGISQFIADVAPVAQVASHPHRRHLKVLRPNGRCVEVFLAGDPCGAVVIYLAECTLCTFARSIEARFHASKLCVVSLCRPGYGATSPPPERTDDLECMAADVEAVVEQLGGGSVVIAGHGTSAAFAFALAAAKPDLAARVVVFAGTVPRPHIEESLTHAPFAAALLRARDASPNLFRIIVRTSGAAWRRLGTRRFNSLNLARSEADSAIARSDHCVEEFDQALQSEFVNGYARLEADLMLTTDDWSDHVVSCAAPTILLHGAQDPVTNIATVRDFAAGHDKVTVLEVPTAGYLLHQTHADLLVSILQAGLPINHSGNARISPQ